jgi:D-amino-acid dehydrogenase
VSAVARSCDVAVLGAGIVGVAAAWHLLKRGRSVALVDRREPGEETSYGNAGVVERDGFLPLTFPRSVAALARYALNRSPEAYYHPLFLPRLIPWLLAFRAEGDPARLAAFAEAVDAIQRHAVAEHRDIARDADAEHFFRDTGWVRLYRTAAAFAADAPLTAHADRFGVRYEVFDAAGFAALEPHVRPVFHRAVLWADTQSVSSPGGVTKAYAARFAAAGGRILTGDATSLKPVADGWQVETAEGPLVAREAVVALGPWATDVLAPLGYRFPLAVKRGYHRHYRPRGNATLARPVVDMERGFVITPMLDGIRLTTGVEFADRDAPPTPVQVARAKGAADELFPLAEPVEAEPWMGRRPCFPDSLPAVGHAPRHDGLWLDFGHGHIGFTLGPATGRLLAEMMTGERPFVDPRPFSPDRFG